MKYQRAVHGDTFAQTERLCCETCGQLKSTSVGDVEIGANGVEYKGQFVPMTICETEVFRRLATCFGKVVHKGRMHRALYAADPNGGPDVKILDIWICKIRKKLKAAAVPLEIKTVWGVGYQLLALPVGN